MNANGAAELGVTRDERFDRAIADRQQRVRAGMNKTAELETASLSAQASRPQDMIQAQLLEVVREMARQAAVADQQQIRYLSHGSSPITVVKNVANIVHWTHR